MSVVFSGSNQGSFNGTGLPVMIAIPSGYDYIWVKNLTASYAAGSGQGCEFYWQNGYVQGRGTQYTKTTSTNALSISEIATNGGFFFINNTVNIPSASQAISSISNATPPLVSTGNTTGLYNGSIVRIFNVAGAQQLGGYDFTVDNITTNTSFALAYMQPIAAGTTGSYRVIPYNPYYYPSLRYITNISQASQAIVTLSVTHTYQVGQTVSFRISPAFGMVQLDASNLLVSNNNNGYANIVAVGQPDINGFTNTITIDVNTSNFSAFVFPTTTSLGFTPAQVVPVGEDTALALQDNTNLLADSVVNTGFFGVQLQPGANGPGGQLNDVIFWVAGKSFSVSNNAQNVV